MNGRRDPTEEARQWAATDRVAVGLVIVVIDQKARDPRCGTTTPRRPRPKNLRWDSSRAGYT
jgi:hypothetical protein